MNKYLAFGIISLILVGLNQYIDTSQQNLQQRFEVYTRKYGKFYGPSEKIYRTKIYEERIKMFEAHNSDNSQTYQIGENQFTDLTQEEFESIYLRKRSFQNFQFKKYNQTFDDNLKSANWINLTSVKDQGQCGASWAFAAIGAVESVLRIDGITNQDLSEQQLIDCDFESQGCDNGQVETGLAWISANGLTTSKIYPYTGKTDVCKRTTGQFQIKGYQLIDPDQMQSALVKSPITATVDGSSWLFYKSGIFNQCTFDEQNHDVLIIGFQDDGTWIVKNSWGLYWGENGIIRLAKGNSCGIQDQSYVATL